MNINIDLYLGVNLYDIFTADYKTKASKVKQGSITAMMEEMSNLFYSSNHKVIITNNVPYENDKVRYLCLLDSSYIGLQLDHKIDFGVNWFDLKYYVEEIKIIKTFILDLYGIEMEPKFFVYVAD